MVKDIMVKERKLSKEQKERLTATFGLLSDAEIDDMMNEVAEYEQRLKINIEKAKIILGEEFVKNALEKNPNGTVSFQFYEPSYDSLSLEDLKLLKKHKLL